MAGGKDRLTLFGASPSGLFSLFEKFITRATGSHTTCFQV